MKKNLRKISYSKALNEAIIQEMEKDPNIFVYGLGVTDYKKIFGLTDNIIEKFGKERCFETPLCEDTMIGFGLGSAINGLKPINIHTRVDFLILAMNQLINMVSSYRYGIAKNIKIPFVIKAIIGRGWGQGFQHSKSLHSIFSHIPGLKVVMPTTPRDAKGLLISSIRDNNPIIFIEHRWLFWQEAEVPEESFAIPLGKANIIKNGKDLTIVATSWMNVEALQAAQILKRKNVSVEIIDPRTIFPLDEETIIKSVKKTGHCIIADNDWLYCGFASELAAMISEKCFKELKAPVKRIGFAPTPCPTARHLENNFYPTAKKIIKEAENILEIPPIDLSKEKFYSYENKFKGPF